MSPSAGKVQPPMIAILFCPTSESRDGFSWQCPIIDIETTSKRTAYWRTKTVHIYPCLLCWPSHIVEVDEAKFGKMKFNRLVDGTWVVGGIQRDTDSCSLFICEMQYLSVSLITRHNCTLVRLRGQKDWLHTNSTEESWKYAKR